MDCIDLTSNQSKMLRYVAKHSKQRKPTKVDQIIMHCIDLTSKRSKHLSYVAKLRKTTKRIKLQLIASIWHQNNPKCWDTSQNYESDQITMHCIDLTSKSIQNFWVTSQNIQNNANQRKWSNYNALHRFDV